MRGASPSRSPAEGSWLGQLRLVFEGRDGRTVLVRRDRAGPVAVQRPFHPGDGACHTYLLHPPGGLARDDRIEAHVKVRSGGFALVTTPAATKVYRSLLESSVTQCLDVGPGCGLEWLPQETILFGGSRYRVRTHVRLARDARFSGWDIVTLGRPASGDGYEAGAVRLETRIDVGEEHRLVERLAWNRVAGEPVPVLDAHWGLGGNRTLASYYAYPADADTLERARNLIGDCAATGATLLDDLLVVRTVIGDVERARGLLTCVWEGLRRTVSGLAPSPPRVWAT
ncbi:MAG: urease accessory protein UreD [Gammaproteobacteria bacterium]|nr:urease accessory protein UreD [Gammaproteobacteria bacterium]